MKLEVGNYPRGLAFLPVGEVKKNLFLPGIWVLPINPSCNLLGQDFINPKGSGRSLPIEPLGAAMVKVRVIHVLVFATKT
jgi:hypothetical protein